ncbi:endonuclease/exonuclease/phosphatase family protein [Prauserella oleivorans]
MEGHAGRPPARRSGDARARRLVLAARARRPAPVVEVALGRAGAHRRPDGPLPHRAPDPAQLRRPRGPQRHPQPRRDPVLGRLRDAGQGRLHLRRRRHAGRAAAGERFVIAGDYNADPYDGDSVDSAATQVLEAPRVHDPRPASLGAVVASREQGGANDAHQGDPRFDTADFSDGAPGNLRVDYVLPSRGLVVRGSSVFWPVPGSEQARLNDASDHHLVRVDVRLA